MNPNHPGARYALGTALAATGDADKAMVELKEAARLAPANPLPYQAIARLHMAKQEPAKALDALAEALKVQPQFLQAHLDRGDILVVQKQDDKALEEYQAVVKLAPKHADVHVKIGMLHERNKRYADAERAYLAGGGGQPEAGRRLQQPRLDGRGSQSQVG